MLIGNQEASIETKPPRRLCSRERVRAAHPVHPSIQLARGRGRRCWFSKLERRGVGPRRVPPYCFNKRQFATPRGKGTRGHPSEESAQAQARRPLARPTIVKRGQRYCCVREAWPRFPSSSCVVVGGGLKNRGKVTFGDAQQPTFSEKENTRDEEKFRRVGDLVASVSFLFPSCLELLEPATVHSRLGLPNTAPPPLQRQQLPNLSHHHSFRHRLQATDTHPISKYRHPPLFPSRLPICHCSGT